MVADHFVGTGAIHRTVFSIFVMVLTMSLWLADNKNKPLQLSHNECLSFLAWPLYVQSLDFIVITSIRSLRSSYLFNQRVQRLCV